ncbi:MAG: pyruvate kinase [Candidatus Dojkabacteria bacterium]|nr:pyruvate kinase [Candidatus Dojkabacteria bacterium]
MEKQAEIIVTLPGTTTREFLELHKKAGATGVRIHTAKINTENVIFLIKLCLELSMQPVVDLAGNRKARTLYTPGMVFGKGLESKNRLLEIETGDTIILVGPSITDEEINLLRETTPYKYLRITAIPDLEVGDKLEFADGKVVCNVIDNPEQIGFEDFLAIQVERITNTAGIYWKMGITSSTKDICSASGNILSEIDISILRELKKSGITQDITIALSFVSYPEQILDVIRLLREIGFDLERITLQAKIETIQGVENILRIVKAAEEAGFKIEAEVARGDLAEAGKLYDRDLRAMQQQMIESLVGTGTRVIIATGVAESAIQQVFASGTFEKITASERRAIIRECLYLQAGKIVGWMLAGETMITGRESVEVTRNVKETIDHGVKVVQRFQSRL